MRISCVISALQLDLEPMDVILFPEGISQEEIAKAKGSHPQSIIVGAFVDDGYSRGFLLHRGQNNINYLKVMTDGRTRGSCNLQQNPVYQIGGVCIGVLVCMDVNHTEFSRSVAETVRASPAKLKLVCIPADMGDYWFRGDGLQHPNMFEGIHVVLCNHTMTHQIRCKSFITDVNGVKIVVQREVEPIIAELH